MATVFEEQNISKAIMRMGLPAMLGQLTTLIYNIADTFFVSLTKRACNDCRGYSVYADSFDYYVYCFCLWYGRKQCDCQTLRGGEKERSKKYAEFLSVCNGDCRDRYSARRISLYEAGSKNIGRRRGEHGLYL